MTQERETTDAELRHDIARYAEISAQLATENEQLRGLIREATQLASEEGANRTLALLCGAFERSSTMQSRTITATVARNAENPEHWNVEMEPDEDGAVPMAIFIGPDAEERARLYAAWLNG